MPAMSCFARVSFPSRGCLTAQTGLTPEPARGDRCVVEMENGQQEVGTYLGVETQIAAGAGPDTPPMPRILRLATPADLARAAENAAQAEKALQRFVQLLGQAGIYVKPLAAHYLLGRERLLFIFSSRDHVDCRRVVGQLQRELKTRIEVWHAAARDEMAVAGGIGQCGRLFCCATWLRQIKSVNIRMAKEQGIDLSPMSIDGCCGRLKCCLRFEHNHNNAKQVKVTEGTE